ncbi:MAG: class I SAM-dependent methyltransferase [Gammaproteobacteria bacterium]|nr:class I SAM-dependent methyltransferase [Gammaproteobacteria bacterium]
MLKQWYEQLFENYSKKYDEESFTQGTIGECDFIEKEIDYIKFTKILDIGCGTGRHAIELTKRGYTVTGIDLSRSQIERAREKSKDNGLEIEFYVADALSLEYKSEFDLVIMMCEGAFPLMQTDEMNYKILENASNALMSQGKLIFTTLNGLFPLYHSVKEFINSGSEKGETSENTFDLMTFRDHSVYESVDDSGNKLSLKCNERYYVPSEIMWLVKSVGFNKVDIYGARLGAFSRTDALTTEDYEMLVIAEK